MLQSGYSYCNSTSTRKPSLKVKSVRLRPGCTSPSTVQTSRFSFRSFVTILPFAPRRTFSTFVIESFQWNPNGGGMSSTASAEKAETKNAVAVARITKRTFIVLFWVPRKELEHIAGAAASETHANSRAKLRARADRVNCRCTVRRSYSGNLPLGFFVKIILIRGQK